jgi:hypothetical protein
VVFNFLIALFTGFGALQQLAFDGLLKWHLQPLFLSLAAVIVTLLFMTSGIALLRRWPTTPRLITLTGTMSVVLHIYGVLPPHRNMGFFILIVAAGYFICLGYALGAAFGPAISQGLSPHQGHSPGINWLMSAGHSHRLTSGGKAEAVMAHYF